MNNKTFQIWLINNDYTRLSLASRLELHRSTLDRYINNNRFPMTFTLALKALENNEVMNNGY